MWPCRWLLLAFPVKFSNVWCQKQDYMAAKVRMVFDRSFCLVNLPLFPKFSSLKPFLIQSRNRTGIPSFQDKCFLIVKRTAKASWVITWKAYTRNLSVRFNFPGGRKSHSKRESRPQDLCSKRPLPLPSFWGLEFLSRKPARRGGWSSPRSPRFPSSYRKRPCVSSNIFFKLPC